MLRMKSDGGSATTPDALTLRALAQRPALEALGPGYPTRQLAI
jgi:hypothetical protein